MNTLTNTVQSLMTDATKVIEKAKATSLSSESKIIGYADIEKARREVVTAMAKEQISVKAYAEVLNNYWAAVDWFDIQWNDKGLNAEPIHKERDAFVSALQAKGHSNPRVSWQRIREAAKLMRYPEPKVILDKEEVIEKDEETKVTSNSPEVIQSTAAKYLATLIDKIQKSEAPSNQMLAALPHIKAALTELNK